MITFSGTRRTDQQQRWEDAYRLYQAASDAMEAAGSGDQHRAEMFAAGMGLVGVVELRSSMSRAAAALRDPRIDGDL